ncbi:MAG: VOC family protein [Bacilli bacterium]|nr:VOC family protein [Bacilli bacterium]MBN2877645.1 VOC family protein [Bacilli bacterium]
MKFCWVTIPVNDLEESLDFYHVLLGLPIVSRMDKGAILAFLGELGEPKIELLQREKSTNTKSTSPITVGIEVDSLTDALEHLNKNGVALLRGPFSPNPHIIFAFVEDPDGYLVQLVEHK